MFVYLLLLLISILVISLGHSVFGLKLKTTTVVFGEILFVSTFLLLGLVTSNMENQVLMSWFFPMFMGFFANSLCVHYWKSKEVLHLRKTIVFLEFLLSHMSLGRSFSSGVQLFAGEILNIRENKGTTYDVILQQLKSSRIFQLNQFGRELEDLRLSKLRRIDLIEFLIWRKEFGIEFLELRSIALYQYSIQSGLISVMWSLGLVVLLVSHRFEENIKIVVISGCMLIFGNIFSRFLSSNDSRINIFC